MARLKLTEPLFPISGRVPGATDRKTGMIRLDLGAKREKWIDEAKTRLTLQTYTHVDLGDQVAAIQSLPGPAIKAVVG